MSEACLPPPPDAACTSALASILADIGASAHLQRFLDDDQDDDCIACLKKLEPERIASKYGLPHDLALAFIERCRAAPVGGSNAAVQALQQLDVQLWRLGKQVAVLPSLRVNRYRAPRISLALTVRSRSGCGGGCRRRG